MVHQCEGCGRGFKYLTRHRAKCADARDLLAGGIKRHLEEDERRLVLRTAKKTEWQARKKAEIAERKTREQAKRARLESAADIILSLSVVVQVSNEMRNARIAGMVEDETPPDA
ncbi:hypothetical protein BD311DRAFT_811973 [Dichomitus squalens]|uniref:Uncharacterized protein n=1 Tax=Dichomitus squalens TaxID=114155 RepID=A0A4Q9M4I1_9APHY|nr:hypothetical protein BD311DRAFT_811973 [Dichomitus squalens]